MRKVIANEWMTLDGVVQAPSYADEDVTSGFGHGGWHTRYFDDLSMSWLIENVRGAGGYLLGRGTYEIFAAHWPNAPEEQQVLAEPLNALPKYVASTILEEPLGWQNSRLLRARRHRCGRARAEGGGGEGSPCSRQPRPRPDPDGPGLGGRVPADDRPACGRRRQTPLLRRRRAQTAAAGWLRQRRGSRASILGSSGFSVADCCWVEL
jgi:hypothetical protein